jgi:ribonuclease HII
MPEGSPDFSLEQASPGPVAGIDEVGRGPWAGPVVVAAVVFPCRNSLPAILRHGLNDSKTLSPARREALFAELPACTVIGLGAASVAEIDCFNILQATLRAMARAITKLERQMETGPSLALVDGTHAPPLSCPVRTVIRGDSKSLSIAAASIVAKVTRDRLMVKLGRRYPGFGWERNIGYGTAEHREGLVRLGITPHHRRSFKPIKILSQSDG